MKTSIIRRDIFDRFRVIMGKEIAIRSNHRHLHHLHLFDYPGDVMKNAEDIYHAVWRIFETTRASFVPRSYNLSYNLTDSNIVYESVAAHTNMVIAIATEALDFLYDGDFGILIKKGRGKTVDGYSYREIMEAIRLHDLPENITGDLPDNGGRDEDEKRFQEAKYLKDYLDTYPDMANTTRSSALDLLGHMDNRDTATGKLIYLSDKVAALMVTLCLDYLEKPPMISKDSIYASERDHQEMEMCDFSLDQHVFKASEMWAIDFFVIRELVKFDEDFFFTALIVMATLMVNDKWYSWREKMYKND